ncbi:MAG TPA: NAD-dependent epimerase/dehydratase family protein [Stellaceae bacterium]|nr:NAD-dependent epimerase/dehydratase family protein [Stellaceae bacterium]
MTVSGFIGSTILVVGGAGFVGGALVRRLLELQPHRVIIVDNLLSADISTGTSRGRLRVRFYYCG